jgi:hypothetical protein
MQVGWKPEVSDEIKSLGFTLADSIHILGMDIDSELELLDQNFDRILDSLKQNNRFLEKIPPNVTGKN